jgi:cell division septum initiation protein DivIVA
MSMGFHPDDIDGREFFSAPDGYDRAEVKAFLKSVASEQRELLARIEQLTELAEPAQNDDVGGDVAKIMRSAKATAEELLRRAEMEAAQLRHRAEEEATMLRASTEAATQKLRAEAEVYAEKIHSAVEREAGERLSHLARRADRVLAGEARIRDRLFSLETTLQTMRGEMQTESESLYPQLPEALARTRAMPPGDDGVVAPPSPASPARLRESEPEPEIVIDLNK